MEGINIQSLVKLKNSNIQGQVKMIEYSSQSHPQKITHVYITLNNNAKHPDARYYRVSHQFSSTLLRCAIEDIETRTSSTPKDIYKLIDELDFEGIKLLSQRGLEKKPTVNAQKEWGTSMNYAIMFGNKDIIMYMLDKGLKPTIGGGRNRSMEYKSPFDLLLYSTAIGNYEDLKLIWDRFESMNYNKGVTENALIWGPNEYYNWRQNKKVNGEFKLKLLFEKSSYINSKNKIDMLKSFMYNGKVEQAKYMISTMKVNPHEALSQMHNGESGQNYCKEQLKKAGSSLEELLNLYENA